MSWERYLLHGWLTAAELNRIDARLRKDLIARLVARGDQTQLAKRVADLEERLARVALLTRSLAELCLAKGALTRDELAAELTRTDLADGVPDGRLDPRVAMPGERKAADPVPEKPRPIPPRRRRRR